MFFDRPEEETPEDKELIIRQQILIEEARLDRERRLRIKAFLDSEVYKDIKSMIEKLKAVSSDEARAFKNSEYLYGIDFLTKFERMLVENSII
jgi:hypothetical protein